MRWRDISSFSQKETDRTPIAWMLEGHLYLDLRVHRHIHYPPDVWLLTCRPWFDLLELNSKDIIEAKQEAIDHVKTACRTILQSLEKEL